MQRGWAAVWATAAALPIVLVVLLRGVPSVDEHWEQHPAHFWIVFGAGAASGRRPRSAPDIPTGRPSASASTPAPSWPAWWASTATGCTASSATR